MPTKKSPSFLWPFLLSLFFIHLPLLLIIMFVEKFSATDRVQANALPLKPLMFNLQSLPIIDLDESLASEEPPDNAKALATKNFKTAEETVASSQVAPTQSASVKKHAVPKPVRPIVEEIKNPVETTSSLQKTLALLEDKQKQGDEKLEEAFVSSQNADPEFKSSFTSAGDYLPNYKVGNTTYINAMAHPHVAYYVAIKRKFRTAWNPFPGLRGKKAELPPGQIESVWGISIDSEGRIVNLVNIESSPIVQYDNEVRRTILSSAPFGKPPEDLLSGDKTLHVAWSFVVYY